MLTITRRQYDAVAAAAAVREVELLARVLSGPDAPRRDAAEAALRIAWRHDIRAHEDIRTLGEIMVAHGTNAADPGGVAWVHEIVSGAGADRGRRLRECWSIVRTVGGP